MNPKASVIIPVFNAEKTLRRCVESIVMGLEHNLEVILCEDCSKDNSWELCCMLSREFENVRCFRNSQNSGVSHTRNVALSKAQGEYILFVDSDDWVSQQYAQQLLKTAQDNPNTLTICGHHFIDKVNGSKRDYLWTSEIKKNSSSQTENLFDLCDSFLLQQLWNKIFRRDLIERHHVRFDESQSMGEDFQFVLDYMEAAHIKTCTVLNEPLYYYIRWNSSSLMSKFGFSGNQAVFDRIDQLARIARPSSEDRKSAMTAQIRNNYAYHIARDTSHTKSERLEAIRKVMAVGNASVYYRQQRMQFAKERLVGCLTQAKQLIPRIKGRFQRSQTQKKIANAVSGLNAEGITFISQNCIGGILYHDLGMQFLSPTVNTFIPEPGFVKMVLNLRYYMEQELVMHWGEEYPIGTIDDAEIHFMHYSTCKEAKESWNKRKARINWDKIFVIATDRNKFDDVVFAEWKKIPYPKVLFTAQGKFASDEDSVYYPEYEGDRFVPDLIPNREIYKDGVWVNKVNQVGGIR